MHYYAMEYVEGQTLAEVIRQMRQMSGLVPKDEPAQRPEVSQLTRSLILGLMDIAFISCRNVRRGSQLLATTFASISSPLSSTTPRTRPLRVATPGPARWF